jgi:hypothetical protein
LIKFKLTVTGLGYRNTIVNLNPGNYRKENKDRSKLEAAAGDTDLVLEIPAMHAENFSSKV